MQVSRSTRLWSEHDQLTDALLTKGFFRPGEHPTATFSGVLWSRGNSDTKDQSVIHAFTYGGLFELNGIEKWIEFPATVQIYNDKLSLESNFSLDRQVFDVKFRDTAGFGLLTDEDIADDVAIRLRIDVPLGEGATAAREPIRSISEDDPGTPHTPAVTESASAFTETIPSSQIQFEMVLVPGDDGSGAEPFYLEKHEVTWDEFMPWVEGRDLASEAQVGEERAMKLRPSSPYGSVDRNFGMFRRPALGMSRLAAEQYCKWLSEQTGRAYRLPTEAEWCRAYVSGGGNLDEPPGRPRRTGSLPTRTTRGTTASATGRQARSSSGSRIRWGSTTWPVTWRNGSPRPARSTWSVGGTSNRRAASLGSAGPWKIWTSGTATIRTNPRANGGMLTHGGSGSASPATLDRAVM